MIEKYGETDVTNIENPQILSLNPFAQIAKRPRIMKGIFKSPTYDGFLSWKDGSHYI